MVAGASVAGPLVRLACQRHLDDLVAVASARKIASAAKRMKGAKADSARRAKEEARALKVGRGLQWRPDLAARVFRFFECLSLASSEDIEQPFVLEPWQKFIVGALFGWLGPDGHRRFRRGYVEIGKGNGKTPMAAGIGLYGMLADGEADAEVYSAANGRDQAKICWQDAANFVDRSPALKRRTVLHALNIAYPASRSFFRPVSSEGRGLDGKRVHIALIDELHEHPTDVVVDKMSAGTKGRRQALVFEITNSGYDRQSVCYRHHEYSVRVLEGRLQNDNWFAYIACLDEKDDPLEDEACWIKANPNLGVSITLKYLREQVEQARGMPAQRNIVLRLNFCVWTESATQWIPNKAWDECGEPVDLDALEGRDCYGGLDLSTTTDITAFGMVFPPKDEGERWKFAAKFWIPGDNIHRRREKDGVPYDAWAKDGYVTPTEGNVVDYAFLRRDIIELGERFVIKEIAFDRFNASQLVTELMADGFTMVPFGQGFLSMSAPSKQFESMIVGRKCAHGNNPVLKWMAANVMAAQDPAGNIKPDKAKSKERIDGIVALIMALGRAIVNGGEGPSVYETRGVIAV